MRHVVAVATVDALLIVVLDDHLVSYPKGLFFLGHRVMRSSNWFPCLGHFAIARVTMDAPLLVWNDHPAYSIRVTMPLTYVPRSLEKEPLGFRTCSLREKGTRCSVYLPYFTRACTATSDKKNLGNQ